MDMDKINRLVELRKQRVLVGDGELPLIRGSERSPLDHESIQEYDRFLRENAGAQMDLERTMSKDEIKAAEKLYLRWFRNYLEEDNIAPNTES